jgi:hypothetical protein
MMGVTRLRALFALFLFLLILCSCVSDQAVPLIVTVRDHLTEAPIVDARCCLAEVCAHSNASGRCRFEEWTRDDHLRVEATGYQADEAALSGVKPSGEPPEARMEMALFPDRIEGVIVDAYEEQPIPRAKIRTPQGMVYSDASGEFVFQDPVFPVSLTVEATDHSVWQGTFLSTTVRVALRPTTLDGVITDRYGEKPIVGAAVTFVRVVPLVGTDPITVTTGEDGSFRLEGVPESFRLRVQAEGYHPEEVSLERTTRYDLSLRPSFLRGLVRDVQSGQPISQTRVIWNDVYTHTDAFGRFFLQDIPEELNLQILAPGYAKEVITAVGTSSITVDLEPFHVRGIYITAYVAGTADWFGALLDFVDQTDLNAVVIEAKDAYGAVTYDSQVPLVRELDTLDIRYDVHEVLRECKERGIYTVAYIVTFEDSYLADARPDWAIQSVWRGGPWRNHQGLRWTDPYRREVWEYNVALAKELASLGFDEVQFDYIRFPTDGDMNDIRYSEETNEQKQFDTIAAFLEYAYGELAARGVFLSADIFGYAAWRKMWEQGQDLSLMTHYLDYVCPMAYPSHYSPGELGCPNPTACPYEIILETLRLGYAQMTEGQRALLRPWLQDFTISNPPYGPAEIEAQIRATQEGGGVGWCLWNAANIYTDGVNYRP